MRLDGQNYSTGLRSSSWIYGAKPKVIRYDNLANPIASFLATSFSENIALNISPSSLEGLYEI